jgi:hypothetical protein
MTFRALQGLGDKEAAVVLPLRDDPTALRITGESDVGRARKPAQQVSPTAAEIAAADAEAARIDAEALADARARAAQVEADRVAALQATRADTGFGDDDAVAGVKPVTAAVTKTEAAADDMGFGDEGGPANAQAQPTTIAQNTVEDVGVAEESDDDLDARIAGILPK